MAKQQTTKAYTIQKSKHHKRTQQTSIMSTTYNASAFGGALIKRIRTPHANDVLSGRGGGINGHVGNIHFRKWVAERKEDYNLAPNKAEKSRVAREVIAVVQAQDPPGRFLKKDPTSVGVGGPNWYIELDDDQMMAKTSQALREGAPQIRAAHKDELTGPQRLQLERRQQRTRVSHHQQQQQRSSHRKSPTKAITATNAVTTTTSLAPPPQSTALPLKRKIGYVEPEEIPSREQARAIAELQAHLQDAASKGTTTITTAVAEPQQRITVAPVANYPNKRVRMAPMEYNGTIIRPTDVTPPLQPAPSMIAVKDVPPIPSFPGPLVSSEQQGNGGGNMRRIHSLAFSDISDHPDYLSGEFVNPFEDETELGGGEVSSDDFYKPAPLPGVLRQTSVASDMGGYGALFQTDVSSSPASAAVATNANNNTTGSTRAVPSIAAPCYKQASASTSSSSSSERPSMTNNNRSLSVLSDLPDARTNHHIETTDFTEGMKTIYDALHPDVEDDVIPTHLFPYRGAAGQTRRSSGHVSPPPLYHYHDDGRQ